MRAIVNDARAVVDGIDLRGIPYRDERGLLLLELCRLRHACNAGRKTSRARRYRRVSSPSMRPAIRCTGVPAIRRISWWKATQRALSSSGVSAGIGVVVESLQQWQVLKSLSTRARTSGSSSMNVLATCQRAEREQSPAQRYLSHRPGSFDAVFTARREGCGYRRG